VQSTVRDQRDCVNCFARFTQRQRRGSLLLGEKRKDGKNERTIGARTGLGTKRREATQLRKRKRKYSEPLNHL